MALRLVTPPAGEIVTLAQAKTYLRKLSTDDDALVEELITAARQHVEGPGMLNAVFAEQTWELVLDEFPVGEIAIPLAPVQDIVSVSYYDEDGALQAVNPLNYYLDAVSRPPWVLAQGDGFSWPATLDAANTVIVRFLAGYPVGSDSGSGTDDGFAINIPRDVKLAIKMLVQHWHDNRGVIGQGGFEELPYNVRQLLHHYRMFI